MKEMLFTLFWHHRLYGLNVVRVKGWRTALVESPTD